MKKFVMVLSLCLSSFASAGITTDNLSSNFNRLTETQKAEIAKTIAENAEKNNVGINGVVSAPTTTIEEAHKWVDLGTKFGQSIGSAARELGVLVSDFLKTPVGKLTAVLIIWKIIGADLIHLFGAGMMFFFILPLNIFIFRHYLFEKTFNDFTQTKVVKGVAHKIITTKVSYKAKSVEMAFGFWSANAAIVCIGLICLFTI